MKRAVAYIRVSTASDAQVHSFEFQEDYWKNEINKNDDLILVEIYADKGISGKSLSKRPELKRLLKDAEDRKFDVVYTKSVSRFARNTTELLESVRRLRELGIKVVFEKENIDTFDPSAEVFLTIAAAVAENDLRVYSENQKWSVRQRFKKGQIQIGCKIFGYEMDYENNNLIIREDEAIVIRKIYELYLNGYGFGRIKLYLEDNGYKNGEGKAEWNESSIRYILKNEKYKGCSLAQKTVMINGVAKVNDGFAKQYYMEDSHDAIISKEDFDKVQMLLISKQSDKLKGKPKVEPYSFTGIIRCGVCGGKVNHKINNSGKAWQCSIWMCGTRARYSKKVCDSRNIKDDVLKELFVSAYNEFVTLKPKSKVLDELIAEREKLIKQENELNILKINRLIELDDYNAELERIKNRTHELTLSINDLTLKGISQKDYVMIDEFDEEKVRKFLDNIVLNVDTVTFNFINGISITKHFDNGPSGNQKGWKERRKVNAN